MLPQGHPLKRLMIERTEGCSTACCLKHGTSSFGASPGVHHLMHGHAGVQEPHLPAPSTETAACTCTTAEKIQRGKLCYWHFVTVAGKNNHTISPKKERLFLQKVPKLNALFSCKWTRTFRQHLPSFLLQKRLRESPLRDN